MKQPAMRKGETITYQGCKITFDGEHYRVLSLGRIFTSLAAAKHEIRKLRNLS